MDEDEEIKRLKYCWRHEECGEECGWYWVQKLIGKDGCRRKQITAALCIINDLKDENQKMKLRELGIEIEE